MIQFYLYDILFLAKERKYNIILWKISFAISSLEKYQEFVKMCLRCTLKYIVYVFRRKNIMSKVSGNNHSQAQMNHHSNQSNPNNYAHHSASNNHSNQCNPNNSAYHSSRGNGK